MMTTKKEKIDSRLEVTDKVIGLASSSPRRKHLLRQFGFRFQVVNVQVKETAVGSPQQVAYANAVAKAEAAWAQWSGPLVVAADTVVALDELILGKPRDEQEAVAMLGRLSGRSHRVYTGVAYGDKRSLRSFCQETTVVFRNLLGWEIEQYVFRARPYDKAGAYGIQDLGGLFVREIHGCYYNVVGLPVPRLAQELFVHYKISPLLRPKGDVGGQA